MADVEIKKGRGRPASKQTVKAVVEEEPKKRATAENGDAPVAKRGRGRPPKKGSQKKLAVVDSEKSVKGRGKPTKASPAKKKSDDDEDEDDESS